MKGENMIKIENTKPDKHGDATRRKIVESYTLENNYRVKITTWHDKARKAYLTAVSECEIETREGWTWERHTIYADFYKLVASEKVARYSWPNMERAHNIAADMAADLVRELVAKGAARESDAA
jgi:hypothetical protein